MSTKAWEVVVHPAAEVEMNKLDRLERNAMENAIAKLRAIGPLLPFPHASNVQDAEDLRELRPRAGRSPWRGFFRRVGTTAVVLAAIGPEAEHNRRGFDQAVAAAQDRLDEIVEEGDDT